jgi:hypothetical protein
MTSPLDTMAEKAQRTAAAAERAARELAEATAARDARVRAALRDLAHWRLDVHANDLHDIRETASAAWEAERALAIADGEDGWSLDTLFAAFVKYREANARWVEGARSAATNADQVLGMARNALGVDLPRRGPVQDSTAEMTFAAELDRIAAAHVNRGVADVRAEMDVLTDKTTADAEAAK